MNKKFLSVGMIVPLAAAGAVATAPTASASHKWDDSSVSCSLKAWRINDGDEIKVKMEVESKGDQGRKFSVRIYQNGDRILHKHVWDGDGDFTLYKTTDNERGRDHFRAYVRNIRTGDDDTCWVTVREGHHRW